MGPIESSVTSLCDLDSEIQQNKLQAKGNRINTPFVSSKFLEKSETTSGTNCLNTFCAKGGTFVSLVPSLAKSIPCYDTSNRFTLEPGDTVFISCSAGFRRSQTLWSLLSPYSKSGNIDLPAPHATRYGCDPYNDKVNWHENAEEENKPGDEFEQWSSHTKADRLGFDQIPRWEEELKQRGITETLASITEYYNEHYYNVSATHSKGRRVFITYAANAHIHLHRLNQINETLGNVILVHIDSKDLITEPPEEWNTYRASREAYRRFAEFLENLIDCSHLQK
jgi:hypothetical protein